MKKALLLGSSFSALPILKCLQKAEIEVTVCGNIEQDPCHNFAHASIFEDYSDYSKVLRIIEDGDFDYLVPSSNDTAYLTGARIASELGFPGYDNWESASIIHNKKEFRRFCNKQQLNAPENHVISLLSPDLSNIKYPALIKPTDSFSGKGVQKVHSSEELFNSLKFLNAVTKDNECVVEDFVEGSLHSHSAFVRNGEIIVDFFVDEFCTIYEYQVNCSNHPSVLSNELRSKVRMDVLKMIGALNLVDGLIHTQFIARDNDFWILESMRRAPGDLFSRMIELSTGFDYIFAYTSSFINLPLNTDCVCSDRHRPISRHTVSAKNGCFPEAISVDLPFKRSEIVNLKTSGQKMLEAPFDKHSIIFFEHENFQECRNYSSTLSDNVKIISYGL